MDAQAAIDVDGQGLRFAALPEAVGQARRALDRLALELDPGCLENVRLLVSELVTNAIRHGPKGDDAMVDVSARLVDDTLRVEVADGGRGFRVPDRRPEDDVGGWGLVLVDRVASRWGIVDRAPTRVWFEIDGAGRREIPTSAWPASIDRALLDGLRAAVIAVDLDGAVTRWNRHAEQLFGYRSEEAIGQSITELLVGGDDRIAAEAIIRRLRAGEPWEGEWHAPRKDGGRVWVHVANAPVHDDHGHMVGMIGVSVDISQAKHAELALKESEERLQLAQAAGGIGTWTWDMKTGRVTWSESLERIHGLEPGAFGGTFEDFQRDIHPEDRGRVLATLERAVNEDEPYQLDYRVVWPDGTVRWLAVRGGVFRDPDGRLARMAGVCTDVSERKVAERAVHLQFSIARVLADAESLPEATPELIRVMAEAMHWEIGGLWRVDEVASVLRLVGGWHAAALSGRFLEESKRITLIRGVGLPGRVWASGLRAWIPDVARDDNFSRGDWATAEGLHAALAFPVVLRGQVLGVMEFFSRRIREPDEPLLELMGAIGSQIGQFVERKATEDHLSESQARTSAIVASALEGIVTMDEDGTIAAMNPAACEMFGLSEEEAVGNDLAATLIPERLRERHRRALDRHQHTGRGRILGRRLELSALRADGSEFPVELAITRVDRPDRRLFTGYIRDVTSRRRVEELRERLRESERTAHERLQVAHEQMTFLADASVILASSLDHRKTLAKVARLAVPRLADWCSVEIVEADGSIGSVAVAHTDPEKVSLARDFRRRYPPNPDDGTGVAAVIRTGRSELFAEITDEMIDAGVADPEQRALINQLGLRSAMTVPLEARGRVLGALTFASAESGRVFGDADLELAQDLARRAALSIDNARLYEERSHVARTLQRTLLPRQLPDVPGVEVASFYQPAGVLHTDVGGDFYDVFGSGEGTWSVVIGDVCGKGVEAAALTGLARHTLKAATLRETSPSAILADLNEVLLHEDGQRFCTVVLGRFEPRGGGAVLTVASGGHPLPVVLRADGRVEQVGAPGTLIGVFERVDLHDRTTELEPGDTLVLYTDGLIDARQADAMDEAALRSLIETCSGLDAQQMADRLGDKVVDPRGEAPDDSAVLVLRVRP